MRNLQMRSLFIMQTIILSGNFMNIILLLGIIGNKNQYPQWVSDVTTSLIFWFPAWHF